MLHVGASTTNIGTRQVIPIPVFDDDMKDHQENSGDGRRRGCDRGIGGQYGFLLIKTILELLNQYQYYQSLPSNKKIRHALYTMAFCLY